MVVAARCIPPPRSWRSWPGFAAHRERPLHHHRQLGVCVCVCWCVGWMTPSYGGRRRSQILRTGMKYRFLLPCRSIRIATAGACWDIKGGDLPSYFHVLDLKRHNKPPNASPTLPLGRKPIPATSRVPTSKPTISNTSHHEVPLHACSPGRRRLRPPGPQEASCQPLRALPLRVSPYYLPRESKTRLLTCLIS